MKTLCSFSTIPDISVLYFYYSLGGGGTAIVAAALAVLLRKHNALQVALYTIAIGQGVTSLVETAFHFEYVASPWIPIISYMFFVPLLVVIGRNTLGIEYKSIILELPKFLKSTRLMITHCYHICAGDIRRYVDNCILYSLL